VDVLFTMLAIPDAVEQAARRRWILNFLRPGALWVDCSSVNPSFSKKNGGAAARREVHFCRRACDRSLLWPPKRSSLFGRRADGRFGKVVRYCCCMGNKIVHTGRKRHWDSMKMVINLLLGTGMAAFTEAMALGEGLDFRQNCYSIHSFPRPRLHRFWRRNGPGSRTGLRGEFPLRWMQKDMHLATVSAY